MKRLAGAAVIAVVLSTIGTTASAQGREVRRPSLPALPRPPALATFEGRTIDLATGWGGAKVCLAAPRRNVLECFRSENEAALTAAALPTSCGGPLRLFEHIFYGGRQLWFYDRGYWQNLTDYGFNDHLSSYIVGPCYAYLAEHIWGGGQWYPGSTSPGAREPVLWPGWNDRVSSLYIP